MPKPLIDLLWRQHPAATTRGARGPRSHLSTDAVIATAIDIANREGLAAVTIRAIAGALSISPMSVYTHVNSREDLLALMVDAMHARLAKLPYTEASWEARVRQIAETNLELHSQHPWLLEIHDDRVALGPGTISKYDYELHAFDELELNDLDRDAALTYVLSFCRASASAFRAEQTAAQFEDFWSQSAPALGRYLGDTYPLAQRVGASAGEAMQAPYSAQYAWEFGLELIMSSLSTFSNTAASNP